MLPHFTSAALLQHTLCISSSLFFHPLRLITLRTRILVFYCILLISPAFTATYVRMLCNHMRKQYIFRQNDRYF